MNIITHTNPDIDAVCASLFLDKGDQIAFTSAADEGPYPEGYIPYDIGKNNETKGKLVDGRRRSALEAFAERHLHVCPRLLTEVNEQEITGKVSYPRFSLPELLNAVKCYFRDQGLQSEEFDHAVMAWAKPLVIGIQQQYEKRKEQEALLASVEKIMLSDGTKGVIAPRKIEPGFGIAANESGFSFAIYADGYNLGVSRYPGRDAPDLKRLAKHLPGWFVHPAGFLCAWGSRKAPKGEPPPAGMPQNQQELAGLMKKIF